MGSIKKQTLGAIGRKIDESTRRNNSYDHLFDFLANCGWSKGDLKILESNFGYIYEGLIASISTASLKNGTGAGVGNYEYIAMLKSLKYSFAKVALDKLAHGKPVVLYVDQNGPQGDLKTILEANADVKKLISVYAGGYQGISLPTYVSRDFISNRQGIMGKDGHSIPEDEFYSHIRQTASFCALVRPDERCPDGILNVFNYDELVTERIASNPKTRAVVNNGREMFSETAQGALEKKAIAELSVAKGSKTHVDIFNKTMKNEVARRYAVVRFMEDAEEKLKAGGAYYFMFEGHKPAGDLRDTVEKTVFADSKYFSDTVPAYKSQTGEHASSALFEVASSKEIPYHSQVAYLNGKQSSGTCLSVLTRENFTICGFDPAQFDYATKILLEDNYTQTEVAAIEAEYVETCAQHQTQGPAPMKQDVNLER